MSTSKIKHLEEVYRVTEDKINLLNASSTPNPEELSKLLEQRAKCLNDLSVLRRQHYEETTQRLPDDFNDR